MKNKRNLSGLKIPGFDSLIYSSENNTKVENKTPWSGYKNEEELKDQILQLSKVIFKPPKPQIYGCSG